MKVLKFGGTSVGSPERMKEVGTLITDGERKIVVLSAMSGTTNSLVEISDCLYKKDTDGALKVVSALEEKYYTVVSELYKQKEYQERGKLLIETHFNYLRTFAIDVFTQHEEKAILAQGELISTALVTYYLLEIGIDAVLLPALDFMRIDENGEPELDYISENIKRELDKYPSAEIYITQGFIARNAFGEIDNLQRGGSDYTASLIGAAIKADEIQIWTDIDGMHNNDPRIVENTKPIAQLSFDEAAELAYFGAKILHPTSIVPARLTGTPVRLLNTLDPSAAGTMISTQTEKNKIKAVAAKDGITAIKIKSGRMLLAYGFLRKVFEIFESYKTPIDMITTSEVGVSLTIDNATHLSKIVEDLKKYGTVTVDTDQVIVSIAGDFNPDNVGYVNKITNALADMPIRMISYGGSEHSVSLLINASDKKRALNALSDNLFND